MSMGKTRSREIRVAIVGVGNCASSFVQGLSYYRDSNSDVGLRRPDVGGYRVEDIVPVVAFDVHPEKVGLDLSKAIHAGQNCALHFYETPNLDATVYLGPVLDGADGLSEWFNPMIGGDIRNDDVAQILAEHRVDVVINWLPVGSTQATYAYAYAAIMAGCAFVNAIPVPLAADPVWANRFAAANLPILGDDIKSQVGATILHRVLAEMFEKRGGTLDRTYQLNVGGNGDFLNMRTGEDRLVDKRASKTGSVLAVSSVKPENVHIGPSDYIPWLEDTKVAFVRLEGRAFAGVPLDIEVRLSVQDSPNAAGVVVDGVRAAKLALDAGLAGAIVEPSTVLFKAPPDNVDDAEAYLLFDEWVARNTPLYFDAIGDGS